MSIEPFIKCSDIQLSLTFYVSVLDFVAIVAPDTDPASFMSLYAYLEREGHGIHLSQHSGDGAYGNVVYVRVDDVDTVYKNLVSRGLDTDGNNLPGLAIPLTDQTWGMREFSVRDPDNNKLTFGQSMQR